MPSALTFPSDLFAIMATREAVIGPGANPRTRDGAKA